MKRWVLLCSVLLLTRFVSAQTVPDAEWLTTTYAKFAYLTSIHEPVRAAMAADRGEPVDAASLNRKIDDARLDITLSNIKTGPIAEILGQKWLEQVDMATPPKEMLSVQVGTDNYQEIGKGKVSWQTATAQWQPSPDAAPSDLVAVIKTWTVGRALSLEQERLKDGVTYTRYATYTVTIHYQGKTNTYKAMCFFGKDAKGLDKALPEDGYLESNAFTMGGSVSSLDMLPTGLLRTHLRDYPPLKEWLQAHAVTGPNCRTGAGEFCCVEDRCGITTADLNRELSQPVDSWRKP